MATLTEEFRRSWLTSIIGILLFCYGIWLLTWNEASAVHHAHSLDEAYNNVISLNPYEGLQYGYDDNLIHVNGPLIVEEPLTDTDYGISIQAVKLKRRVQMYQWVEERTPREMNEAEVGTIDSDNYYYLTEWRDKLIDSNNFYIKHGHENPKEMPLTTQTYIAPYARIGFMNLGHDIKEKFGDFVEVTGDERPDNRNIKLHLGIYYHCEDIWKPEVGDIRVQFYYAGSAGDPMTVIAKQKGEVLVPYYTKKGHEIAMVRHGMLSAHEMFSAEHFDVKIETWKKRFMGMFILYASSICLARLLRIVFSRVPLLRGIFSHDFTSSTNLAISSSVSLLVIASAWIAFRPMLGIGLLMAAISPMLYCSLNLYNSIQAQNGYYSR